MSIVFDVDRCVQLPNGHVIYRVSEFSFDVDPVPIRGFTSILVNNLSLEVDEHGNFLSVWGLSPYPGWQRGNVQVPEAARGSVKIRTEALLSRGISVAICEKGCWPVVYDRNSGWVAIGRPKNAITFTEVLRGAIIGLDNEKELESIWLKAEPGL